MFLWRKYPYRSSFKISAKIKKIKGVLEVIEKGNSYQIKIESKEVNDDVFKVVSKSNNITKYALEEPSLEEIFVAKVGEAYEK